MALDMYLRHQWAGMAVCCSGATPSSMPVYRDAHERILDAWFNMWRVRQKVHRSGESTHDGRLRGSCACAREMQKPATAATRCSQRLRPGGLNKRLP
eukprot:7205331-Prymnesium_polylepis.1